MEEKNNQNLTLTRKAAAYLSGYSLDELELPNNNEPSPQELIEKYGPNDPTAAVAQGIDFTK